MTIRLGITGYPLSHTRSPALHRSFLRKARLRGRYDILPFEPVRGKRAFFKFLERLRDEGYLGLNVTIPFKEWAFEFALKNGGVSRGVEGKCARLVGAANTLLLGPRGRPRAANTDAGGLWEDICEWKRLAASAERIGVDLVIVGTGGSAKGALAGVLAKHRATRAIKSLRIWGRNPASVDAMARLAKSTRKLLRAAQHPERALLVLWCLPPVSVRDARAIWREVPTRHRPGKKFLYDLNYGARADATRALVDRSRRRQGAGMLRKQAESAFALWQRLLR